MEEGGGGRAEETNMYDMNRMKNLFTLLTLLLWTLVACSNDSAADEKPGSGGTDIPAGNLPDAERGACHRAD